MAGAFALLARGETWFIGGYLLVLCVMPGQIGQWLAPLISDFGWPPLLVIGSGAMVLETAKLLAVPLLARFMLRDGDEAELAGFGACLGWAMAGALWVNVIDLLPAILGPNGWGGRFLASNLMVVLKAVSWLVLLPILVRMAGEAAIGMKYVLQRLLARGASWFGGFLLLALLQYTLGAALRFGLLNYYAPLVEAPSLALAVVLAGVVKAFGTLLMMLYALCAAQVIAAGADAQASEIFD